MTTLEIILLISIILNFIFNWLTYIYVDKKVEKVELYCRRVGLYCRRMEVLEKIIGVKFCGDKMNEQQKEGK